MPGGLNETGDGPCLLHAVQIPPLDILHQSQHCRFGVGTVLHNGPDGGLSQLPDCHPPAMPGDELIVAVQQLTHQNGLDQAVFPDALRQFL